MTLRILVYRTLLATALVSLALYAHADEVIQETTTVTAPETRLPPWNPAMTMALADGVTTLIGLSTEVAKEQNGLIGNSPHAVVIATIVKMLLAQAMENRAEPNRTLNIATLEAIWGGAAANNLGVLAGLPNPVSLLIGLGAGLYLWSETEEQRVKALEKASSAP